MIADIVSSIRANKKPPSFSPEGFPATNQIAQTYCFRFLRQPSRPNAPRPDANSGRAAGTGVADGPIAAEL